MDYVRLTRNFADGCRGSQRVKQKDFNTNKLARNVSLKKNLQVGEVL